jgi:O-antigen biosynthesis protein WbqV
MSLKANDGIAGDKIITATSMPPPANISALVPPALLCADHIDWSSLLKRDVTPVDPALLAEPFRGKRILITGAAGSIGSALAKSVACFQPERLILLDSAEHGLYELESDLRSLSAFLPFTIIPGDVCDAALLREILAIHRPHIVYHAAAYKHVPLMEHHPLAALKTNAIGTCAVAQACHHASIAQLILLSTDKAVAPSSIMGASKRIGELACLALSSGTVLIKALRLGNVLGSRGSVVPRFQAQIAQGGPITVTHPDIERYFLSLRESVELLLLLAHPRYTSGIHIPSIGAPIRVLELARFLISSASPVTDIPITFTGLRPGDKMQEELLAHNESIETATGKSHLHRVTGPQLPLEQVLRSLHELQKQIQQRNTHQALQIVHKLLPNYQPSDLLHARAAHPVATL